MKAIEKWQLKRPNWFADTVINFRPGDGEGWSEIVDDLFQQIEETLAPRARQAFHIGQIKEKIGSLRLYFRLNEENDHLRPPIDDIIEQARLRTERTCMICGAAGEHSNAPGCMMAFDDQLCPIRPALERRDP